MRIVRHTMGKPIFNIVFFGIPRSLRWTLPSIQEKLIFPLSIIGTVRVFAHYYKLHYIDNRRSGESQAVDPDEYTLIAYDDVIIEEPNKCLEKFDYNEILAYGDSWGDGGKSLSNLVHQLNSLNETNRFITASDADVTVFVRPDLKYYDCFVNECIKHIELPSNTISIPDWQWYQGVNDRFAICGPAAARAYSTRIMNIQSYFDRYGLALNSERLLWHSLNMNAARIRPINIRAARVRSNGFEVLENFKRAPLKKRISKTLINYYYSSFWKDE